jgi:hypothetical protein
VHLGVDPAVQREEARLLQAATQAAAAKAMTTLGSAYTGVAASAGFNAQVALAAAMGLPVGVYTSLYGGGAAAAAASAAAGASSSSSTDPVQAFVDVLYELISKGYGGVSTAVRAAVVKPAVAGGAAAPALATASGSAAMSPEMIDDL